MDAQFNSKEILREFGVEFSSSGLISQFGGLKPFIGLLKRWRFLERLSQLFGKHKARSMMQLVIGLICGARDMEDVERVGRDSIVRRYLKISVVATQLSRDFKSFTRVEIEKLHEFNMGLAILELVQKVDHDEKLILDVDATAVTKYGQQEGVEAGYIEENKIEDCYQYLFFRLHNLNTFLYGTIRGGSAHSQNDFCGYLKRFLPMFKKRWQISLRADAGYFSEGAFDLCSDNDAHL